MRRTGVSRPTSRQLLVVGVCALALAAGAVLARTDTAVDDATVDAARADLVPSELPSAPAPSAAPPLPEGSLVVRPDGVDGLRLEMGADEVVAAGYSVSDDVTGGCRRVLPGLADTGPGEGVSGWLVEGRVAAVTVDDRVGDGSSFLGPGLGDPIGDLPTGDGLLHGMTTVSVPWQDELVTVEVAWVTTQDDVRVAFADLDSDGDVDHVQVRARVAAGCAEAAQRADQLQQALLPVLDLSGWGELRLGTPVEQARELVDLQLEPDAAPTAPTSCGLLLGDGEPGLVYVVVGEGTVRSVAVDAGVTDVGLRIGDPPERVRELYPGITAAYLGDRWDQGLTADWQLPGGTLRLSPTRERVVLSDLDAVITGPRDVVGVLQVGEGCSSG